MDITPVYTFSCPYCMAMNQYEIDLSCDLGQVFVVDCQRCCQPIDMSVMEQAGDVCIEVRRDND